MYVHTHSGMDILFLYMMFYERPSIKRIFSESEIIEQDHFFAWRLLMYML